MHHSAVAPEAPGGGPQDDDFLYLVMEYLPGGDVMVRYIRRPISAVQPLSLVPLVLGVSALACCVWLQRQ